MKRVAGAIVVIGRRAAAIQIDPSYSQGGANVACSSRLKCIRSHFFILCMQVTFEYYLSKIKMNQRAK